MSYITAIRHHMAKKLWDTSILFYISVVVLLFTGMSREVPITYNNSFSHFINYFRLISYACMTFQIIVDWIRGKEIDGITLVLAAAFLAVTIISGTTTFFLVFMLLYYMKDMNFSNTLKNITYIQLALYILVIALCCIGLFPDWTYRRTGGELRHSVGFIYCLYPFIYFFFITIALLFVKRFKVRYQELALFEIIALLLYFLTDAKTDFILFTIVVLAIATIKFFRKKKNWLLLYPSSMSSNNIFIKIIQKIWIFLPLIFAIISFTLVLLYDKSNSFWVKVDSLLTYRLSYTSAALQHYGIKFLGQNIQWYGVGGKGYVAGWYSNKEFVDNAFMRIFFDYGILGGGILLFLLTFLLRVVIKKKDYLLAFLLNIVMLDGIMECQARFIEWNLILFSAAFLFNTKLDCIGFLYRPIPFFRYSNILRKFKNDGIE